MIIFKIRFVKKAGRSWKVLQVTAHWGRNGCNDNWGGSFDSQKLVKVIICKNLVICLNFD